MGENDNERFHDSRVPVWGDCRLGSGSDPACNPQDSRVEQSRLDGCRVLPFRPRQATSADGDLIMKWGAILAVTLGVIAGEAIGRMVGLDTVAAKFGA